MRKLHCWICGTQIRKSAVAQDKPFYLEVRIVGINRPYGLNYKSLPVSICRTCAIDKVGMSREGTNLNK